MKKFADILNEDYSQRARNFRVALRRRLETMKKGQKISYGKLFFTAQGGNNFRDNIRNSTFPKGRLLPGEEVVQSLKLAVKPDILQHRGVAGDDMVNAYLKFEKETMEKETLKELGGLFEKLCKKGKAYRAKRMRAGEKSSAYLSGRAVKVCKGQMKSENIEENVYYVDAVNENEAYCPVCTEAMLETVKETLNKIDEKKGKCKPSKGKRFAKRVSGKCRSFGQKGKAKKGGDRIRPGTKKGNAYCARSAKIKKCKNPPCANALSRKKWKCQGSRSVA